MGEAEVSIGRGPKCAQVLEGARKVFMERGFEGASVDEIARAAGTSKATLYSYFPDKRQLFEAVVRAQCGRTGEFMQCVDACASVEEALRRLAFNLATYIFSPGAQEMFRVCIAESRRFPELGQAFYTCGPERGRERLIDYFRSATARGDLRVEDADVAADQFLALCKAGVFLRAMLGAEPADPAEVERIADEAVRTFVARYGPRG